MALVRRRLSWLICGWLACQLAGYVAAPLALCCEDPSTSVLPDCCQAAAPGQTCPMHHNADQDDRTCKMRNACARGDSALLTLSGGLGVMPTPTGDVIDFTLGDPLTAWSASATLRTVRPESPPPRS
jgi:hypothetical protein